MKKLLGILFVTFTMLFTSCGLYQMITYPQEIKEQGGEIKRDVTAFQYELMDNNSITQKATDTQSYLYLYEKDDTYYWNIRRSEYETKKTFFPQDLTFKITSIVESEQTAGKFSYNGEDVITGDKWSIVILKWKNDGYGYFYVLTKEDDSRKIIYSVHLRDIITSN